MVPKVGVEVVVIGFSAIVGGEIVIAGGSVVVFGKPNTGGPLGNVGFALGYDEILVVTPNTGVVELLLLLLDTGVSLIAAGVVVVETIAVVPNGGVNELALVVGISFGVTPGAIPNENVAGVVTGNGFSLVVTVNNGRALLVVVVTVVLLTVDIGNGNDIIFSLVVVITGLVIVFGRYDSFSIVLVDSIALGFL